MDTKQAKIGMISQYVDCFSELIFLILFVFMDEIISPNEGGE